jgi:hypothetical protein
VSFVPLSHPENPSKLPHPRRSARMMGFLRLISQFNSASLFVARRKRRIGMVDTESL